MSVVGLKFENMQISGLVFKLAKPLGNKAYNDLVSGFSLQCLHQPFLINVKGFFRLSLPLLGDLFALSITYLIILMQFLMNEDINNKMMLKSKLIINATEVRKTPTISSNF
uniref:Putative gustatory receptor 23a, isoform B n=1 Tax=Bactrocera latifrons TaxID=174628 RepID=A0A0K8UBZ6_BACLA